MYSGTSGLPQDYNTKLLQGKIPGYSVVNKFGRNIQIDSGVTADIWDGGYTASASLLWVPPTVARIHQITSTQAADDDGSTGTQTIQVYGLKTWSSLETSEVITMNGVTNVPTGSYVIIHRMKQLTAGSGGTNAGIITATADSDATVTAQILAGQGQTQMAIYGIPTGVTAYMGQFYGSLNKSGGAATGNCDMSLRVNSEPDSQSSAFVVKHTLGLALTGTSALLMKYAVPNKFTGPAIILLRGASSVNGLDVSAGFDLVLHNTAYP